MYVLYGGGVSRAMGPQMVLEEAGLAYEVRTVDTSRGEHRTADFLAMNPAGFVPALKTPEGAVLHEAAAIMLYLADRHGLEDLAPTPDDPARGPFLAKLFYLADDIQPPTKRVMYPERFSTDPAAVPGILEQARAEAMDRWGVVDAHLAQHGPYALGERFSLVDLYMTLWAAYGLESADDLLQAFPAVRRCHDLVAARPKIAPLIADIRAGMVAWRGQD